MASGNDPKADRLGEAPAGAKPNPERPPQSPKPDPDNPISHPPRGPDDPGRTGAKPGPGSRSS